MIAEIKSICKRIISRRSPHWPSVRSKHLFRYRTCAACNSPEHCQVHHCKPFHLFPELELDEANLITLCERPGLECHLKVGHLGSWFKWNPNVRGDAEKLRVAGKHENTLL